jgi:Transposase DDE domain
VKGKRGDTGCTSKKKEAAIVTQLKATLSAPETVQTYRVKATDWTRRRKLGFEQVAVLILRGHKISQQSALNRVYKELGHVWEVPTASAYCQARQKLQPELFVELNGQVGDGFYGLYEADGEVKRWRGHRVVGIDGTVLNLPDTVETRAQYSVQANQYSREGCVQALGSVCYDVLNHIGLSAGLSKKQAEKEFIVSPHLAATQAGDVVVLDRAYADYGVMAFLLHHGREFVIRMPQGGFAAVQAFWASSAWEQEVELEGTSKQRAFVGQHGLARRIRVRLVKVVLDNGEIEVLATSLCQRQRYPRAEFKQVYGWRWGIETYYDRVKNIFEVERFSGQTVRSIEQDFYGVIFLATLEGVLSRGAEAELVTEAAERATKYVPQVNHAVSYLALVDYTVALLLDPNRSVEHTLQELHHLFQTVPTRHRPGRHYPRRKQTPAHQLRYQRYQKRLLA